MHHYELLRSQRIPSQVFPPTTAYFPTIHLFRAPSIFSFPTTSSFPLFSLHRHRHHYHYILHSNNWEKMRFVVERVCLPSPSVTCTIFVTRIGEPELEQFVFLKGQWKQQEMNLYNYVTTQWSYRALNLRTGTSTSTRFNLTFLCVKMKKSKWSFPGCLFSMKELVRLFILKEVKHSPDGKMIKPLRFDYFFPPLRNSC